MRLRFRIVLAALLCTLAVPAAAQQRGFEAAEVEELLRGHVASSRILLLVQQRCISFEPTKEVLLRFAAAGATDELLEGLLAPGLCRTGRPATAKAPPAPAPRSPAPRPRPADSPEQSPARTVGGGRPLFFAGIGYSAGSFRADGGGPTESGHGAAGEIGVGGAHFAVFARGAYADIKPSEGDDYSFGHGNVGVRLVLLPVRAPVRPYVEVAFATIGREYTDAEGNATRTVSGTGGAGGAGVRVGVSRKLELDASWRGVMGSLTRVEDEGGTERLDEAVRGRGNWWSLGLHWTPGR